MDPVLTIAFLWLLFGLTHVGLATAPLRAPFVARFGELGFVLIFSAVAVLFFTLLVATYAAYRFEGPPGLALGQVAALRPILIAAITLGVVLMAGTFATYDQSPYSVLGKEGFPPPRGLERITRHPFFAGLVLFALAHALLATRLVGAVFLVGYAVVSIVGAWHQQQKLLARLGPRYAEHLRATSAVPFAAILAGRQRLVWRELPFGAIAIGIALTVGLRAAHDWIFAWGGLPFIAGTLGAVVAIFIATLMQQSTRTRPAADRSAA